MELKRINNNNSLTSQRSSSGTTPTRLCKKSPRNATSLLSRLSILIFALSCAILVNTASGAAGNRRKKDGFVSPTLIGFGELSIEQSEEFKRMAWNNWMNRLESDWKHFHESVEEAKAKWLREMDASWADWLRSLHNKWSSYSEKMLKEHNCNVMKESAKWNDAQWVTWIKTDGRNILEAQWEKWIKKADDSLQKLILDKWIQWKNDKIRSWLSSEWKTEEDYYWAHIERSSTEKCKSISFGTQEGPVLCICAKDESFELNNSLKTMETVSNYQELEPETLSLPELQEKSTYSSLSSYEYPSTTSIIIGVLLFAFLLFISHFFQFHPTIRNKIRRFTRNAILFNTVQKENVKKDGKELPGKSSTNTESKEKDAKNNNQINKARQNNEPKQADDNNIKRINKSAEKREHRYNTALKGDEAKVRTTKSTDDRQKSQTSLLDKIIKTKQMRKGGMKKLIKKPTMLHTKDYNDKDSTEDLQEEKSTEWKNNQWNIWKKKNEDEWKIFNTSIENEKGNWLQGIEKEWQEFLDAMQNKWIYYNRKMDAEYQINVLEKSPQWDDTQWIEWIKTEGKQFIEQEWKTWLAQKEAHLNDWVVNKWIQWKNSQIIQWLMTDWRLQEEASWSNYENYKITYMLQRKKRKEWNKWKERINREREEWDAWVRSKEKIYINTKWNKWSKWKKDKRFIFSKWVEMFTNTLINERQWEKWIKS
ncbi:Tryptophan/threonine rich antigen [Plasmodium coatneyi]|uniref:Tryptophan/threonine rich antigen n=1 Tax=Plasmodium coatneyi TaxID=208452 RepID=A0A1B1DVL1_9APIC|nr:Tryptophan/threonine rich antigen [Plasmodium coatneyi]ANQ06823.1 Tryptophan/threonine rich antigen [Plasmodium coatneyi]